MPYLKTEAITLRRVSFSESSQILSLLTRDHGRIRAIAKGAHRPKSAFGGPLDLAQRVSVVYWPKPPGTLDILASADLVEGYAGLRRSLRRVSAACCALELVEGLSPEGDPQPEIYDLLRRLLEEAAGEGDPDAALLRFEARLLREIGHFPRTAACVACLRPVAPASRLAFSGRHGGVLCPACPGRDESRIPTSPAALALLETFGSGSEARAAATRISPEQIDQLRTLLHYFLSYLLDREPRSFRFLQAL